MSGPAFWSHDIGGFGNFEDPTPTDELYIRWLQFGLFSTHSRFHGLTGREPQAFSEKAMEIFNKYAGLRYKLIPYLYSYAQEASQTGLPVMRPLVLEYQTDPNTYNVDTEYLLGREILVAPIFEESKSGTEVSSRTIYLPPGKWIDYWTKKEYEGESNISYTAPLEILPLFVKKNSIIPLGPRMNYVDERPLDPIELDVYLDDKADFTLHYNNEATTIEAQKTSSKIELTMDKPNEGCIIYINDVKFPSSVNINGQTISQVRSKEELHQAENGWVWNQTGKVTIKFKNKNKTKITLKIEL